VEPVAIAVLSPATTSHFPGSTLSLVEPWNSHAAAGERANVPLTAVSVGENQRRLNVYMTENTLEACTGVEAWKFPFASVVTEQVNDL
jgi:hypothetical protein